MLTQLKDDTTQHDVRTLNQRRVSATNNYVPEYVRTNSLPAWSLADAAIPPPAPCTTRAIMSYKPRQN